MKFISKILLLATSLGISSSAFALIPTIDVMATGGYTKGSNVEHSVGGVTTKYTDMKGYNAELAGLVSFSGGIFSPIFGAGVQVLGIKSTTTGTILGIATSRDLTEASTAAVGHLGLKISLPIFKFYVLGNAGYGLTGKQTIVDTALGFTAPSQILTEKSKMYYGASAMGVMSIFPFIKVGLGGAYNLHSTSFQDQPSDDKFKFTELSANLVVNLSI